MNRTSLQSLLLVAAVIVVVAGVALWKSRSSDEPELQPPSGDEPTAETIEPDRPHPRMVDLGADKCIPCKKMAPILRELMVEYAGRAHIEFIDVWKNPDAGTPYNIRLIPTQIFLDRDGNEVWRHEGFLAKDEIVAKLAELGAK